VTLDRAQREAKRIVGNAAARAYGLRRTDDHAEDACEKCGGDGCHSCWWTGDKDHA
jgi:hypothetical protein